MIRIPSAPQAYIQQTRPPVPSVMSVPPGQAVEAPSAGRNQQLFIKGLDKPEKQPLMGSMCGTDVIRPFVWPTSLQG